MPEKALSKYRIGKFKASRELLFQDISGEIFAKAKIVPLGLVWEYNGVAHITGISPLFEEVEEGTIAPEYGIIIHNNNGEISVEAKKIE